MKKILFFYQAEILFFTIIFSLGLFSNAQNKLNDSINNSSFSIKKINSKFINDGIYPVGKPSYNRPYKDLEPLNQIIKNAKFVGLGENMHGSEGFGEERARIIKYLISEKKFRLILLETPFRAVEKFTKNYVENCEGTSESALKGVYAVWSSASTNNLFKWVCEFNKSHPNDKVLIKGIDIQNENIPYYETLQSLVPTEAVNLNTCFGFGLTRELFSEMRKKLFRKEISISDDDNTLCISGLNAINEKIENNEYKLPEKDINNLKITITALTNDLNRLYYRTRDFKLSLEYRDLGMSSMALLLSNIFKPKSRAVVWAHNAHLAANTPNVTWSKYWENSRSLGTFLRKKIGNMYSPIALTGFDVEYWDDTQVIPMAMPVPAIPSEGSVENILHKLTKIENNAIVDLRYGFFKKGNKYPFTIDSYGSTAVPFEQFDGIFFMQKSQAMIVVKPEN